jgi:hypothetical protein
LGETSNVDEGTSTSNCLEARFSLIELSVVAVILIIAAWPSPIIFNPERDRNRLLLDVLPSPGKSISEGGFWRFGRDDGATFTKPGREQPANNPVGDSYLEMNVELDP